MAMIAELDTYRDSIGPRKAPDWLSREFILGHMKPGILLQGNRMPHPVFRLLQAQQTDYRRRNIHDTDLPADLTTFWDPRAVHHQGDGHVFFLITMMGVVVPSVIAGDDHHRILGENTADRLKTAVGIADRCDIRFRHSSVAMPCLVGILHVDKRKIPLMRLKPGEREGRHLTVGLPAVIRNIFGETGCCKDPRA